MANGIERNGMDGAHSDQGVTLNEVPSVNRRKAGNKIITILGFFVIAGFAGALMVAVSKDKKAPQAKAAVAKVENTLPPIAFTPAVPDPIDLKGAQPVPAIKTTGEAKAQPVEIQEGPQMGPDGRPVQTWVDRKRSGFGKASGQESGEGAQAASGNGAVSNSPDCAESSFNGADCGKKNDFSTRMEPTITNAVSASILPNRNFLITKGTSLDCVLETAIDSTVPGLTTCRLTRDIYSDNAQVLLLDKGSMLVGEYQSSLKLGQARLFVLWTRAKTPNGVVISLNSPSADALGRSGMEGHVDNKFSERFGAAILISLIKDGSQAVVAKQQSGGGATTNNYGNTTGTGTQIAEKAMDGSVNIQPTLTKNQGDHIQIMVARDLDFSTVYELKMRKR